MSFSRQQARLFSDPIVGKTTTFLVDGRQANLEFSSAMVALFAEAGHSCAILDLDAFYASNADRVFSRVTGDAARSTTLMVPAPGADVEGEFSRLFEAGQGVIIVDSLNSFYHLLSLEDGRSRSRKLTFAVAALSNLARNSAKAVIFTMYKREGFLRTGTGRSISGLSDVTASVEIKDGQAQVKCERGSAWSGRRFSISIPP
jgi:hypothetical protein